MVDSNVGPILTVMMSLSLVILIFCSPVYCCNTTTVGVEDQYNYDDVEHDNCDEGGNYDHDYLGDINDCVDVVKSDLADDEMTMMMIAGP